MTATGFRASGENRVRFLDAVRGVLAGVVTVDHLVSPPDGSLLQDASWWSVATFFAMSGYVLSRAWDGSYWRFLLRRAVRLWPAFAICTVAGALVAGRLPSFAEMTWWPTALANGGGELPDPSSWSLYVEAYACLVLPAMFLAARKGAGAAAALVMCAMALTWTQVLFYPVACFAVGAAASAFEIRWPAVRSRPLLWLGKVSYSLYLVHDVLIAAVGPAWTVPLLAPATWLLWRFVELPSIALSRRVTDKKKPRGVDHGASLDDQIGPSLRRDVSSSPSRVQSPLS